ncbi:uncharacterized protein LOC6555178 isoform X2 [Drosophila erecta]|uniref:uncharacterized protein LOC6555178 isoform X2 n=1 Tax=Drosophila erecta TaxID=7220 RepID=UPI0007328BDD|nr:uncharacterized protein LOC6555178 isoform X2 [Drosophila erecta]KQS52515.1 uncharacterized protein Dere_GG11135, isoform C [Drosophila erecta]
MDDEFKLCWKNFQDNIASGFQNLYDRGDLVDVTLACDGKLLHAHKIVLAICSPYFQEIFTTNPCKHPIIILKDVSFNIMMELLEFMYQGVVNVKHTELQSFMKIGQLLQIKGLATNSNSSPGSSVSEKSSSQPPAEEPSNNNHHSSNNSSNNNSKSETDHNESKGQSNSRTTSPGGASRASNDASHLYTSSKRPMPSDFGSDSLSIYSGKQLRRSLKDHGSGGSEGGGGDHADSAAGLDNSLNSEEFFMPPIPQITMGEQRYDLGGLKRESDGHHHGPLSAGGGSSGSVGSITSSASPSAPIRNPFAPSFSMDSYNFYKGGNSSGPSGSSNNSGGPCGINNNGAVASGTEYPNELYMPNDYSKNFANHMDIPSIAPGEHWFQGKLEFMLSQRGKPLLVHDGHTFGIQYVRKDKKYWQCNLSRKFNCKARVTTTDTGDIIVTNNEHCHTEIRQHLRKDYQRNKVMMNALINLSTSHMRRQNMGGLGALPMVPEVLTQGTPIHEMVQNLHEMAAKVSAGQQHHQQQQQQRVHDLDEPLDCGLRSSAALDEMARSFMTSNKPSIAFPGSESGHNQHGSETKEEPSWKEKIEGDA